MAAGSESTFWCVGDLEHAPSSDTDPKVCETLSMPHAPLLMTPGPLAMAGKCDSRKRRSESTPWAPGGDGATGFWKYRSEIAGSPGAEPGLGAGHQA